MDSVVQEEPIPDIPDIPDVPESERLVEPGEAVVIKKRGRPKGSLNKKTIEKRGPDAHSLDVDFTSDEVLGEPTLEKKKRPKAAPKVRESPPPSESSDESPPPEEAKPPRRMQPPKLKRERAKRVAEPEPLNPPSYLEVLTRGLKEAKAKQYAEKVPEYDRFFQW